MPKIFKGTTFAYIILAAGIGLAFFYTQRESDDRREADRNQVKIIEAQQDEIKKQQERFILQQKALRWQQDRIREVLSEQREINIRQSLLIKELQDRFGGFNGASQAQSGSTQRSSTPTKRSQPAPPKNQGRKKPKKLKSNNKASNDTCVAGMCLDLGGLL